jgi:hypothetical protein
MCGEHNNVIVEGDAKFTCDFSLVLTMHANDWKKSMQI